MKTKIIDIFRTLFKISFLEKYLVGLTIGKDFGDFVTKLPPNHYQYRKGSIRKVDRNGINYYLNISDIVDWYIYFGFKEKARTSLLSLIDTGQTVFDVGANVGNITLEAAKIVNATGKIHSFEPDPENYQRMKKNMKINDFKNINLNKFGLGNKAGVFTIANVSSGNKGMNRIVHDNSESFETHQIHIETLDNYAKKENIKKIDLIKIDVEGFEYNVLKGGISVIERFHPIFFIELDNNNLIDQGSSAQELIKLLESFDYDIIHSESKEKITSDYNFDNCHFDIIAKNIA